MARKKPVPKVERIICLMKAFAEDGVPLVLNYFSLDWGMLLFPNIGLAEKPEADIGKIKDLLATRLSVPKHSIVVDFDRTNRSMMSVCTKPLRDRLKRGLYGEIAEFYHYYCLVSLQSPPGYLLRRNSKIRDTQFRWVSLAELKSDPEVSTYNADVLDFIGRRFDSTMHNLPLTFDATVKGVDRVFVITAFRQDMGAAFEGIKAAGEALGLYVERVVDVVGDYRITDQILEMINKSVIVVADLTHERPNVYFELGYARGIGKPVVTIAKQDTNLHFDVKDWTCLFYSDSRVLERDLKARFAKEIEKVNRAMPILGVGQPGRQ